MKTLYQIFSFGLLGVLLCSNFWPTNVGKVVIDSNSEVFISGTSNVNSFNCYYDVSKLESPIPVNFENKDNSYVFHSTFLELENSYFDCGHKAINKDFNKLLQSDIYPTIKIQLIKINQATELKDTFNAKVKIHIGNTSNFYEFPVQIDKEEVLKVKGELNLNLCDFNIEAPKKMLGLIVVDDEIDVNFNLYLKTLFLQ